MAYNKGVLEMQADRLRSKGYDNVYVGFNEFSIPSIRETAEEMVGDGYDEILILPFFVASGLHVTRDIPVKHFGLPRNATDGMVEIEGKQIKITIDQPFGEDPNLTDILQEMIEELRTPGKDTRVIVMATVPGWTTTPRWWSSTLSAWRRGATGRCTSDTTSSTIRRSRTSSRR